MEFLQDLTGSLLWAAIFSLAILIGGGIAVRQLAGRVTGLRPAASALQLVVFFVAVFVLLHFSVDDRHPRLAKHLHFFNWLVFTFAVVRLFLYAYGDLFVIRLKKGSFPAAFKNIITAAAVVVAALFLLKEILNINLTSLIAATTVLTATIGLAFQSTLANMLAGLTIHLEKPLKQGDWISSGGYEGHVMDITLRSTRIMTIENNEVFIPNSKVLSEAVVNYSLPDRVQIRKLSVGVSYSVPPNKVKEAVLDVLSATAGVKQQPKPLVRVLNYGDFSVHYEIRYPISDFSRHVDIEAEIMGLLWYRFNRSGIEIPFPIRNVNIRQVTPESLQAGEARKAGELSGLIKAVDIFSALSGDEIGKLVRTVHVQQYAAGEVPVRQGEAGDSFYIIKQGRVDVVVESAPGEKAVVASLGPGNFFGEMSLLTGAVRTASIVVKDDAEFIVIDKSSFSSILAHNPSIAESLSLILSERQAVLEAERERLDVSALDRRKKDFSHRMLGRIREFFGLKK